MVLRVHRYHPTRAEEVAPGHQVAHQRVQLKLAVKELAISFVISETPDLCLDFLNQVLKFFLDLLLKVSI